MLVKLKSSKLFSTRPSRRFADEYDVPECVWEELWRRYKMLDYTIPDLADYFEIKAGRKIKRRYMKRWLFLGEVYLKTKNAREMGAEVINTSMFGKLEPRVVGEVTRHMRRGSTKNSRIML